MASEVDMLIINKPSGVEIENGIGEFFDGHNLVVTAYGLTRNEDKRLAEAIVHVLTSANEKVFEKMKEDDLMASALMELMKLEVEKYTEEYAKETYTKQAKIMLQRGEDNEYIKLLTNLADQEIEALRQAEQ